MIGQDHYKIEFKKLIMGQMIYVCIYIYIFTIIRAVFYKSINRCITKK